MTTTLETLTCAAPKAVGALTPDPFLHFGDDRVYNPLTDRTLLDGEPGCAELRALKSGQARPATLDPAVLRSLTEQGWLVERSDDLDQRFLLKYVSLEAHTICNQACYFCPVSINPRKSYFMPTEKYEDILRQLAAYRDTIEGIFMINYNEPTVDKRFLDQVRSIKDAGLPPAVLTNGSGLTRKRLDAMVEMGGVRYLSINLSTLDQDTYKKDRGSGNVEQILRNLDHAKDLPVAPDMEIVVLGTGNDQHRKDHEEIQRRFAGSRFVIKSYEVMDRAGYLELGLKPSAPHPQLCGCENVGSRPLQHLHITPHAKVVLCCEDYDEHHIVGDLNRQTVDEVLRGPGLALMRRYIYGLEAAPEDFICRNCVFALKP
ncbi:MAG: radical SAM/SPASM domain-containing protein [Acidobacteriota bacterium]